LAHTHKTPSPNFTKLNTPKLSKIGSPDGDLICGERGKKIKRERRTLQRKHGTKTSKVVGAVVAVRRAAIPRVAAPSAATYALQFSSFLRIIPIKPSTPISRATIIVIVPVIKAPFPDIPVHVVQAKSVGGKAIY